MRLALAALLAGCTPYHRIEVEAASAPVPVEATVGVLGTADECQHWLLGFIPLRPRYTGTELLDKARGDGRALVQVTMEERGYSWLLGYSTCHEVRGYRVAWSER